MQIQRELKAAKAEKQRVREELESREEEALKLRAQLDLQKSADDSWLVSGTFGDMGQ